MKPRPWNTFRITWVGFVFGVLYGLLNIFSEPSLGSWAYVISYVGGSAVGGGALFAAVSGFRNWATGER